MMLSLGRGLSPILCISNGVGSLADTLASAVFDLDATIAQSYDGTSQYWQNLIPTPADGSAKSDYDFFLGLDASASSDDPPFTGSAGNPAAYFAMGGGDYFRIASNTTFMNGLQKNPGGSNWWFAAAFHYITGSSNQVLLGTRTSTSTIGISLQISSTDRVQLGMRGDGGNVTTSSTALAALSSGTDYLIIGSFSSSDTNFRWWVNSATKTTTSFTPSACSSDASNTATLGGGAALNNTFTAGSRIYAMSMGNSFLDDVDALKIMTAYNTRHGRSYA